MISPFLSKVISAYDYREVDISRFIGTFQVDESLLKESLESVCRKYAYQVSVEFVEKGDFVVLSCQSTIKKFQKDAITICVGKNLYSRELEEQLIGMPVGVLKKLQVDGIEVMVKVIKAERNMLPKLTNEFVSSHFETVGTVEELRDWFVNQQLENYCHEQAALATEAICDEVLEKSEIFVDDNERRRAREGAADIVRKQWEFNGSPIDIMTDEEAEELLGYPSGQAYIHWFEDLCEKDISYAALGYELLCQRGEEITPESYEVKVNKFSEEENIPVEELKKQYTFYAYAFEICTNHYRDTIEKYSYYYLKERVQ